VGNDWTAEPGFYRVTRGAPSGAAHGKTACSRKPRVAAAPFSHGTDEWDNADACVVPTEDATLATRTTAAITRGNSLACAWRKLPSKGGPDMFEQQGTRVCESIFMLVLLAFTCAPALAASTVFTYQGRLTDAGAPANANYDLQFTLWDAASGGTQQPQPAPITQTVPNVTATDGVFTVQLDFTVNAFPGSDRFLEIGVRPAGSGSFTILGQRQQIHASPYAIRTISAGTADALSGACVGCVLDAQINSLSGSKVTGAIPVASVPAQSGNYIQNTSSLQAAANFNVGGSGTTGSLTVNGSETFGGVGAPAVAPAGQGRVYFDSASGKLKVSESSAAYVNLVGASGVSGSGTASSIQLWSAGTTLGSSIISQSANNIGIGTATPAGKLDVRGNLVLDSGADPILYTGTANSELNRYLSLINSPLSPSASGLKAGGVLVADSYGYASPGKNDLIVKGNTGMGTAAPQSKLHIAGSSDILFPFLGLSIDQTIIGGHLSGYAFKATTTISGTTSTNFLIDSLGNVGVGTDTPSHRLHVAQGGDYQLQLQSPSSGGGFWNIGQSDNGFGSGGGKLLFVPNTTDSTNAAVVFANSGNVGIGTIAPTSGKLVVNDVNVGTAVVGISSSGSGVFGQSGSAFGWGVYGRNTLGGYAQYAEGNAGQSRDKGGWVKALVYLNRDGAIVRCYNAVTGASSGSCGFTPTHIGLGQFKIDFGFQVDDRFVIATTEWDQGDTAATIFDFPSANSVTFSVIYIQNHPGDLTDAPIHVVVF